MTYLNLSEYENLATITELANLTNLKELILSGYMEYQNHKLTDVSHLGRLINLEVLDLSMCRIIADITRVHLINLKWINLGGTSVSLSAARETFPHLGISSSWHFLIFSN